MFQQQRLGLRHAFYAFLIVIMAYLMGPVLAGCASFGGGGQDVVMIQMPFAYGYTSLCTQGANGSYSHTYTSTRYDIDFDTPNDRDDYVYAPIGGVAYVHDSDRASGFGVHINIDLGDGTYIILAHLDDVLVSDGDEVAQGQLIAIEGNTGDSSGDHLHMGRHDGDPQEDGLNGVSLEGLMIETYDSTSHNLDAVLVSDFVCDLSYGHSYQSRMETPVWHPDGTLVMTPNAPEVYLLGDGYKHHIINETVFWSYNWNFSQVVYVDETELACYLSGATYADETLITAVYDEGTVWLLVGAQDGEDYLRYRVPSTNWQAILKSWGITASTYDDLSTNTSLLAYYAQSVEPATFREGTLVTESSTSDVYVITNGAAYPILDWDTFLGLGFFDRDVIVVDDGAVQAIQGAVGDCRTAQGCISFDDLLYCGGEFADGDDYESASTDDEEEEDEEVDTGYWPEEEDDDEPIDDPDDDRDDDPTDEDEDADDDLSETGADDLGEGLSWIRVDGAWIGLHVPEVFSSLVHGSEVAATGTGVNGSWDYSTSNLVTYETEDDMAWYELSTGWYRMTMRTSSEWAIYNHYCASSTYASDLCHENMDGSYALCFEVSSGRVRTLSSADCRTLE